LKKTNPSSSSKTSNRDGEQYLYLTTRGRRTGLPREIEIWFTQLGDRFYVIAEYATSDWVLNVRAHPEVRFRIAGLEFSANARILSKDNEPELISAVQSLSRKKYGWGDGVVVELSPTVKMPGTSPSN
jgi:deazaflavin-dependent oxidoreductase (nitroreductase family)